ncbi:MAG TPA: histidine phosphatase family protein [Candidatus Saccharimonadales bacterium]
MSSLESASQWPFADRWPTDLFLLRHGQPDRDKVKRPSVKRPGWRERVQKIDKNQALKEIGLRQSRAAGERLATIAPFAGYCLSGDCLRHTQTSEELVKAYPESKRPLVVSDHHLRERDRGLDSPILISKQDFYEQFRKEALLRDTAPSKWQPRKGEHYEVPQFRLNQILFYFALDRPYEKQLIISTSGEMCISAFNNYYLGNMSDEQLVQGFGPGMPAIEYELTAITEYTKRNPFDEYAPHSELYSHMRVRTPNPLNPEGDLAWDTGWLPIQRPISGQGIQK